MLISSYADNYLCRNRQSYGSYGANWGECIRAPLYTDTTNSKHAHTYSDVLMHVSEFSIAMVDDAQQPVVDFRITRKSVPYNDERSVTLTIREMHNFLRDVDVVMLVCSVKSETSYRVVRDFMTTALCVSCVACV